MLKRYWRPALIVFWCILVFIFVAGVSWFVPPLMKTAHGSGTSTLNIECESDAGYWFSSAYTSSWNSACYSPTEPWTGSANVYFGWQTNASSYFKVRAGVFVFDITSIPEDAEIDNIQLKVWVPNKTNTTCNSQVYWSLFQVDPDLDKILNAGDFDRALADIGRVRISGVQTYSAISTGAYNYYDILPEYFDWIRAGYSDTGKTYIQASTENHMLVWSPTVPCADKFIEVQMTTTAVGFKAYLVVTYAGSADDRETTYPVNDAVNPNPLGDEVTDNITWGSPRCNYADEQLCLIVSGDSGAPVELQLLDENGTELNWVNDSIRVDGKYYWKMDLSTSLDTFVKCRDKVSNIESDWGYISPSPDSSQALNKVYAGSTVYPQYDNAFSSYVVNKGDLMFVHWKTNVDPASELADHALQIWVNGDNSSMPYNHTLDWMGDNYYGCLEVAKESLLHWRYAIFTPGLEAGQNDYNQLVNNLDIPFASGYKGFLQGAIWKISTEEELTETHSAYWYLTNASQGIALDMSQEAYAENENTIVVATIGKECDVERNLSSVEVKNYYGESALTVNNFTAVEGINEFTCDSLAESESYKARVKFWDSDTTYAYVKNVQFSVTESGEATVEGDLVDRMKTMLSNWGLDNTQGYWLLLIIACVVLFIIFYRSPVLRVAMPLLAVGTFMVMKLIETWIVVLLALGAGITIWGIFRGKTKTDGGDD